MENKVKKANGLNSFPEIRVPGPCFLAPGESSGELQLFSLQLVSFQAVREKTSERTFL
jgi:hypothetical protein